MILCLCAMLHVLIGPDAHHVLIGLDHILCSATNEMFHDTHETYASQHSMGVTYETKAASG